MEHNSTWKTFSCHLPNLPPAPGSTHSAPQRPGSDGPSLGIQWGNRTCTFGFSFFLPPNALRLSVKPWLSVLTSFPPFEWTLFLCLNKPQFLTYSPVGVHLSCCPFMVIRNDSVMISCIFGGDLLPLLFAKNESIECRVTVVVCLSL